MGITRYLLASASAFCVLAATAQAETIRATTWQAPSEALSIGLEWWSQEVGRASNGDVVVEYFSGGSLVPARSTLQAVADGVAHVGYAYSGYTPSETPVTEAIAGFSFADEPYLVLAAAFADFVMNDEEAHSDWRKHGVIPIGGWSTPKYDLLCNTPPLTSLDDLKGKRVRFPGGPMSQFGEALGTIPVNIPASEAYQAQQTGQTDCSSMRPGSIFGVPMLDVTQSITHLATGLTFASPFVVVNDDTWAGLEPEERRILLDALAGAMAKAQGEYARQFARTMSEGPGLGVEIVEPDDEVKRVVREWVDAYRPIALDTARNTHGIADPEALFARFQTYIDKWEPIIATIEDFRDEDAMTAVFKEHLTDKIDVETFGVN